MRCLEHSMLYLNLGCNFPSLNVQRYSNHYKNEGMGRKRETIWRKLIYTKRIFLYQSLKKKTNKIITNKILETNIGIY